MKPDRRVHGHTFDGGEIVRYERAGKWFIEYNRHRPRRSISLRVAVNEALYHGDRAIRGVPGGKRFDAGVADMLTATTRTDLKP